MTACIVGWSHGKFGKLDGETSESLIVKARPRRSPMPASSPGTSTSSTSAT